MSDAADYLFELCQAVRPVTTHPMPGEACEAAQLLYAACVDFCMKADIPCSAIRVCLFSWGVAPGLFTEPASTLSFDGVAWRASLTERTKDHSVYMATGYGELQFDSEPDALIRSTKKQDHHAVRVITWMRGKEPLRYDPWAVEKLPEGAAVPLVPYCGWRERLSLSLQEGGSRAPVSIHNAAHPIVILYPGQTVQFNWDSGVCSAFSVSLPARGSSLLQVAETYANRETFHRLVHLDGHKQKPKRPR